jgi:hypothetical protein
MISVLEQAGHDRFMEPRSAAILVACGNLRLISCAASASETEPRGAASSYGYWSENAVPTRQARSFGGPRLQTARHAKGDRHGRPGNRACGRTGNALGGRIVRLRAKAAGLWQQAALHRCLQPAPERRLLGRWTVLRPALQHLPARQLATGIVKDSADMVPVLFETVELQDGEGVQNSRGATKPIRSRGRLWRESVRLVTPPKWAAHVCQFGSVLEFVNPPRRALFSITGSPGGVNESARFVNPPQRALFSITGSTLRGLTKRIRYRWQSMARNGNTGSGRLRALLGGRRRKRPLAWSLS